MFRPAVFTRDNFWRNPFYEFDRMFPDFWNDNTELEKSFSGFSTDVMEKDGNYILQAVRGGSPETEEELQKRRYALCSDLQFLQETISGEPLSSILRGCSLISGMTARSWRRVFPDFPQM
jgi:hypothetical protein